LAGDRALPHRADGPPRRGGRARVDRRAGAAGRRELIVAGALDGMRGLEVGGPVGAAYAAQLLADPGAGVVKIEPPRAHPRRRRGPFARGVPHPETSGLFLYLNANKRGIVLDLRRPEGREALDRLVADADLLLHDVHPADMAAHGLDWDHLSGVNPRLVMTSI